MASLSLTNYAVFLPSRCLFVQGVVHGQVALKACIHIMHYPVLPRITPNKHCASVARTVVRETGPPFGGGPTGLWAGQIYAFMLRNVHLVGG